MEKMSDHTGFESAFGYADLPVRLKSDGSSYRYVIHKLPKAASVPGYVWYGGIPGATGDIRSRMSEGLSARVYRKRCMPALASGVCDTMNAARSAAHAARLEAERIGYYYPVRDEQGIWTATVFHPRKDGGLERTRLTWPAETLPRSLLNMNVDGSDSSWESRFDRLDARSSLASEKLIKGRDRVKENAEVLTPKDLVEDMLNTMEPTVSDPEKRLLEPACGDGNFLIAVLQRRLHKVQDLYAADRNNRCFGILVSLSNIYGIDIAQDNVLDTRARLRREIELWANPPASRKVGFWNAVDLILSVNIRLGDFLNPEKDFMFLSFNVPRPLHFSISGYRFVDIFPARSPGEESHENEEFRPIHHMKPQPYWKMSLPDWMEPTTVEMISS